MRTTGQQHTSLYTPALSVYYKVAILGGTRWALIKDTELLVSSSNVTVLWRSCIGTVNGGAFPECILPEGCTS